jgi:gas vesicle protein
MASKSFTASLAIVVAICLSAPKPAHAGSGGYISGAIIGGITAAIIAAEAAKAARQPAAQPRPKHTRARKQKSPENASAGVKNNSADPFAGVMPTRIRSVDEN